MYSLIGLMVCALMTGSSVVTQDSGIRAIPEAIDLGVIRVGQAVTSTVILKNTTGAPFVIKRVAASCGCQKPAVDVNEIAPGASATLTIVSRKESPGHFRHGVLLVPKEDGHHQPVSVMISGDAVQSLVAEVGWNGVGLTRVNAGMKEAAELDGTDVRGPVLAVRVVDSERCDELVLGGLKDIKAESFCLVETTQRLVRSDDQQGTRVESRFTLRPKKDFLPGRHTDKIEIQFQNGATVFIPISFRVHGDVYAERTSVYLGRLQDKALTGESNAIRFSSKTTVWPRIKWALDGPLSSALGIHATKQDDSYAITVRVLESELAQLPRGFLSCRLMFFPDTPEEDDTVEVTVSGFN